MARMTAEEDLIARARSGSREAFEAVVTPHLAPLLAYIRAICGDYHAAHDGLQQTLLVAYRKFSLFFPEADLGTWLRAIARREALDLRKKRARGASIFLEAIEAFHQDPDPDAASPRSQ